MVTAPAPRERFCRTGSDNGGRYILRIWFLQRSFGLMCHPRLAELPSPRFRDDRPGNFTLVREGFPTARLAHRLEGKRALSTPYAAWAYQAGRGWPPLKGRRDIGRWKKMALNRVLSLGRGVRGKRTF